MISVEQLIPECFANTMLMNKIIGICANPGQVSGRERDCGVKGVTKLNNRIETIKNDQRPYVAILDSDRFTGESKRLLDEEFTERIHTLDCDLMLVKKPATDLYIIYLHPAFEVWILKWAIQSGINPQQWGYHNKEDLKGATKDDELRNDRNFIDFLSSFIKANPLPIQKMKQWLVEIMNLQFHS